MGTSSRGAWHNMQSTARRSFAVAQSTGKEAGHEWHTSLRTRQQVAQNERQSPEEGSNGPLGERHVEPSSLGGSEGRQVDSALAHPTSTKSSRKGRPEVGTVGGSTSSPSSREVCPNSSKQGGGFGGGEPAVSSQRDLAKAGVTGVLQMAAPRPSEA